MEFATILKTTSIIFAFALFTICIMLWGEINGFEQGMLAASGIEDYANIESSFAVHGPNFFEVVPGKYSFIALLFVIYLIGKILEKSIISFCLCLLSLGGIIILYWSLLLFKYGIDDTAVLFYRKWLTKSITIDWICFSITVVLFLSQMMILARQLRQSNKV